MSKNPEEKSHFEMNERTNEICLTIDANKVLEREHNFQILMRTNTSLETMNASIDIKLFCYSIFIMSRYAVPSHLFFLLFFSSRLRFLLVFGYFIRN